MVKPVSLTNSAAAAGSNNQAVGHRRWILYPKLAVIGSGDAGDNSNTARYGNAMYVIGGFTTRTILPFVAWPAQGYFPYQTLPSSKRWSFSVDQADFSSATVMVTGPDGIVTVVLEPLFNGYADNTLVFLVDVFGRPAEDANYSVTVTYKMDGLSTSSTYNVIVYDPSFDGTL
jgi:hypothetical protein